MRISSLPPPLEQALGRVISQLVKRLSHIMASSLRGAARLVPPDAVPVDERPQMLSSGCIGLGGVEFCFHQLRVDVEGGSGRDSGGKPFRVKGGNRLERLSVHTYRTRRGSLLAVFILDFGDEEHPLPLVDTLYRLVRILVFGRTRDVEAIVALIPPGGRGAAVVFPHICSGRKTYASRLGAHETCTILSGGRRVDIYVSNVWNHAMATWNTNPGMSLVNPQPILVRPRALGAGESSL